MSDTDTKRCSKCGRRLPATTGYFFSHRGGLRPSCKECCGYLFTPDLIARHRRGNLKRCSRGEQCVHPMGCWQPATKEHFHASRREKDSLHYVCKACIKARGTAYRSENSSLIKERKRVAAQRPESRERSRERNRKYRQVNAARLRKSERQRRIAHPERVREKNQRYCNTHQERTRSWVLRRRARRRGLPDAFTATDWQRALGYFNGCCAVCGRPLRDLLGTHTAAADHWIPLSDPRSDNPGTVPTNIVPLCHGVGGCNNRKSNRDPVEFLETEFGKRRAKQILARINAYFEWVKQGGA